MSKRSANLRRNAKAKLRHPGTPASTGYARYLKLVLSLPGAEESTSYGTPGVKVKGKLLSRLRTEAEGGLALRCKILDRHILLLADPESFYLTDHYLEYPWVLIRLDKISSSSLSDVVQRAWRLVAPKKMVTEFDRMNSTAKWARLQQ